MNFKKYLYRTHTSMYRLSENDLDNWGEDGWLLVSESYLPKVGYSSSGYGHNENSPHEYVYRFVKEE